MSCEDSPAALSYISIPEGGTLTVFWEGTSQELKGYQGLDRNPYVHAMGPIFDFIAECKDNDCTKFSNAGEAKWVKIAEELIDFDEKIDPELKGLMDKKPEPYQPKDGSALWAMAKMIQEKSRWEIKIPKDLKPGKYLVRNELAAIQIPLNNNKDGPQHCG
jgi:cellulase